MSQPNILDLIKDMSVEWKALSEVCSFKNGFAFKSSLFKETGLPIVRITNVDGKYINLSDVKYFNPSDYKENIRSYEVSRGDILVAMSGATTGKIGLFTHKNPAYLNQRVGKFLPIPNVLNTRYLYHYLLSKVEDIYVIAGGGAQPNLSSNALMTKIKIPIPYPDNPKKSLEIQTEIVRILDTFNELTSELTSKLTSELNARKKQYNYYLDQLLDFEESEAEWIALSELTKPTSNIRWRDTDEVYRYIDLASVDRENNSITETIDIDADSAPSRAQKLVKENDIIFATTRPTQMRICLIDEAHSGAVASTGYCILRADRNKILPKWIFYNMSSNKFKTYLEENQSGSAYPAISDTKVKEFQIPIPCSTNTEKSLTEQSRIIAILEKFDTLASSINEILPHKIELRQKQYEYYRDMLLSFPKSEEVKTQ